MLEMADSSFDPAASMLRANPAVHITEFRGGGFALAGADYSSATGEDAGGLMAILLSKDTI